MSFKQFQHLVKLEFFGILIGIVTPIVDDMGIGVVFQQDLGDIDVIVIGRVNQWCETMAVGLIDVHTLGQVVVNRCDILINGGGVDAFDAAAQ